MNVIVNPIVTEPSIGTGVPVTPITGLEGQNVGAAPGQGGEVFSFVLAQATSLNIEPLSDEVPDPSPPPEESEGESEHTGHTLTAPSLLAQEVSPRTDQPNVLRPSLVGVAGANIRLTGSPFSSLLGEEPALFAAPLQENIAGLSAPNSLEKALPEPVVEPVPRLGSIKIKNVLPATPEDISAPQPNRLQSVTDQAAGQSDFRPSVPPPLIPTGQGESSTLVRTAVELHRLPETPGNAVQRQDVVSPLTVALGQGNVVESDAAASQLGERTFQDTLGQHGQGEAHQRERQPTEHRETGTQGGTVVGGRVEPFPLSQAGQGIVRSNNLAERPVMTASGSPQNLQMDVTLPDATRVQLDVSVQQRQVTANLILDQLALRNLAVQQQGQLETQLASLGLELRDFGAEFQGRGESSAGEAFVEGDQNGPHDSESWAGESSSVQPGGGEWERREDHQFHFVA